MMCLQHPDKIKNLKNFSIYTVLHVLSRFVHTIFMYQTLLVACDLLGRGNAVAQLWGWAIASFPGLLQVHTWTLNWGVLHTTENRDYSIQGIIKSMLVQSVIITCFCLNSFHITEFEVSILLTWKEMHIADWLGHSHWRWYTGHC